MDAGVAELAEGCGFGVCERERMLQVPPSMASGKQSITEKRTTLCVLAVLAFQRLSLVVAALPGKEALETSSKVCWVAVWMG